MAQLVAMLRVKDGMPFLEDWLNHIGPLVDGIVVVVYNGSTDGTWEMLEKHSKVRLMQRTYDFHEGRDKILAYEMARSLNPDWMLWLDVDEWFEDRLTRSALEKMMASKTITRYFFSTVPFS